MSKAKLDSEFTFFWNPVLGLNYSQYVVSYKVKGQVVPVPN
jgi:hypothetical protein